MRAAALTCALSCPFASFAFVLPTISVTFAKQAPHLPWGGERFGGTVSGPPPAHAAATAVMSHNGTLRCGTGAQGDEPGGNFRCFRMPPQTPGKVACAKAIEGDASPFSRRSLLGGVSAALVGLSGAAVLGANPAPAAAKPERIKGGGPLVTLEDGATYQEMTIGDGPKPNDGDRVAVHYSLFYKGLEVESSRDSQGLAARPLGYTVGTVNGPGSVPPGLDEIVKGMRVMLREAHSDSPTDDASGVLLAALKGGRRKITLPPQLAFGKAGRPPFIPPDATVQMDVSLWSVKPAGTDPNVTLPGSSVF